MPNPRLPLRAAHLKGFGARVSANPHRETGALPTRNSEEPFGLGVGQSIHFIKGEFGKTFVTISTYFCISSSDLMETVGHLRRRELPFCTLTGEAGKLHVRADGVRSVYLQDPDGYWIEINEDY